MVTQDVLEVWLFEYAAKRGFYNVVLELCSRKKDILSRISQIWPVLATVGQIVSFWNVDNFQLAIDIIEYVYASKKCVPFKIYAKLITGLKMKLLLCQLKDGREDVLNRLFQYFPRKGPAFPQEDQREVIRLRNVHSHFRKLYLSLIGHESQRVAYFRDEYEEEYGDRWMRAVKLLMTKFIEKITQHLPLTMIEKMLRDGPEKYITRENVVTTEMFLEIVHGKSSLQSCDLMEILTMWFPVNTRDRVQTEHQLTFTNQTDSNSNPLLAVTKSCRADIEHEISDELPLSVQWEQTTCSKQKYPHEYFRTFPNDLQISKHAKKVIPVKRKHKLLRTSECHGDSRRTKIRECGSPLRRHKRLRPDSNCIVATDATKFHSISQLEERDDVFTENQKGDSTPPIHIDSSQAQVCVVSSSSDSSKNMYSEDVDMNKSLSSEGTQEHIHATLSGDGKTTRSHVDIEHVLDSDDSDLEVWQEEYEDTSKKRRKSISDIDALMSDEDGRIVPSSRKQSEEMPDSFVDLEIAEYLPNIECHIKKPFLNLCIIKLFHEKVNKLRRMEDK